MPSSIRIGCRVSARVGAFLPNQPAAPTNQQSTSRPRRIRSKCFGIVIRSAENRHWTVLWDDLGKASDHSCAVLKFESEGNPATALSEEVVDNILKNNYIGKSSALANYVDKHFSLSTTILSAPNPVSITGSEAAPVPQPESRSPPIPTPTNELEPHGAEAEAETMMNDTEMEVEAEAERYDPNEVIQDLIEEDRNGQTAVRFQQYLIEKANEIGKQVVVSSGRNGGRSVTWTVRSDIRASEVLPQKQLFKKLGVRGFDFGKKDKISPDGKNTRIDLLKLLIHLWPGDWRSQLQKLNFKILLNNDNIKKHTRHGTRHKTVNTISPHEFWCFWGIILAARIHGRKGDVWESTPEEGYPNFCVNMSEYMSKNQHLEIRSYIPHLWESEEKKEQGDAWWQFSNAVDLFNKNRHSIVLTSTLKVLDESMSAFRPQTTKTRNLPNISSIDRKPENLGTELKVVADEFTGMTIYLELQRGKLDMATAEYVDTVKLKTSACTTRLVKYSSQKEMAFEEMKKEQEKLGETRDQEETNPFIETYLGDAWFGSIDTVISLWKNLKTNFIGVIKNSHNRYPKDYLTQKMKDWPAGSHLVLEANIEGVQVVAMGYKYCKKKVIHFVFNKGAATTKPGKPYEARWKDDYMNTQSHLIPRPSAASIYFEHSNMVDLFNQSCQHDLQLEKHWITQDGYFRLCTTLFGILVTDGWKAYQQHIHYLHRHKGQDLLSFSKLLCHDLLNNPFSTSPLIEEAYSILNDDDDDNPALLPKPPVLEVQHLENQTVVSSLTNGTLSYTQQAQLHVLKLTSRMTLYSRKLVNGKTQVSERHARGECMVCKKRKTMYYCVLCPPPPKAIEASICQDADGSSCLEKHRQDIILLLQQENDNKAAV